ncbi:hypothetical protein BRARA_D02825 [Brassica rapa]|uniref:F-box domain-containing protein n=1 Tax=Brassica campestris TaxID=3711 RepID=A0A397ZXZ7_BRACM|nr:hypothetical protein BRARA_D02825 [Brassica rapa]
MLWLRLGLRLIFDRIKQWDNTCKTCGENLRNQDVLNEDRISDLPEALLMQILSSLATKNVIATSVLSKGWRSLWKKVPSIKFDSWYHKTEPHRFSEIVYKSLLSYNSPVLDSFYLVDICVSEVSDDITIWIGIAFARHVRKLVLKLLLDEKYYGNLIRFPSVFCNCNNTLDTLEISKLFLLDFPSRVGLKSLKKLHLSYVNFRDDESVCNLLCGCASLEDLVVQRRGSYDGVITFTIAVPSLQRLTIVDTFRGTCRGGYVINAPSLKYLNIKGVGLLSFWLHRTHRTESYGFCLIENAPELVEAKITGFTDINLHNENIFVSLTSAKRLSFDFSPFKVQFKVLTDGITFYQLVSLELNTSKSEWSKLLARMLDSSPKLQILKLVNIAYLYHDNKVSTFPLAGDWEQRPKCVPECLLFHLETLMWTGYIWDRKDDREVATYILKNARHLKKATFYTEPIQLEYFQTLEEKHEMLNELAITIERSGHRMPRTLQTVQAWHLRHLMLSHKLKIVGHSYMRINMSYHHPILTAPVK